MRKPSPYLSENFINNIWPSFSLRLINERSRDNYFNTVCMICDYLATDFTDITVIQAKKYFDHLLEYVPNKKKLSARTIQNRLSMLRSLASYIVENKDICKVDEDYTNVFLHINNIPEFDEYIKKTDIPTIKELNKLLEVTSESRDIRMYLIFAMVIRCAFTASEICKMTLSQIVEDKNNRMCVVFQNKRSNKERYVKLPDDVVDILFEYKKRLPASAKYLFYNNRNLVLKVRNLESLVKKYVKMAGLSKEFTIQDIRNAAICYMKASGADNIESMVGVDGRWMYRYDRVIEELDMQPVDLSKIRIIM